MERLKKIFILLLLFVFVAALGSVASASTVAYWRFEDGSDGVPLPDIGGQTAWDSNSWVQATEDLSGNGNHLATWDSTGWEWDVNVPASTIILSGATDTLSILGSAADEPDLFTWSEANEPTGTDIEEWEPTQFTIEASFMITDTGPSGYDSFVCRQAASVDSGNVDNAALYFQRRPGGVAGFMYTDVSGYWHECYSPGGVIDTDRWYNMVGVCDGQTMSLYLEDVDAGDGFHLVGQTDLTTSGSPDMTLTNGKSSLENSGTNWYAGQFAVGRGFYNAGKTDYWGGSMDEVRISDTALKISECLWQEASDPQPAENSIQTETSLDLSWTPVSWASSHDVYFGDDYNDVRDASRADHSQPGLIYYVEDHGPNSYSVSSLTQGNYYWRVDSNDGSTVRSKGAVWSFLIASPEISVLPVNRYSFIDGDTGAVDDIGGENGTLTGAATIADNRLTLNGNGHVDLPSDVLDNGLTSVSIEAWVTLSGNPYWQRLFDFGATDSTGAGGNCMFYAPSAGGRFVVATNGFPSWQTGEDMVFTGNLSIGNKAHVVCVWDNVAHEIKVYLNGALADSLTTTMDLTTIARQNAYIGESSYPGDADFVGTVDEFRIYDVALDNNDVAASYLAGPDVFRATNPDPAHGASTSKDLTLSWDAGVSADTHDIYIDTDKADVINASRSDQTGVLYYDIGRTSNSYNLSGLTPAETYYWRVDEYNDPNLWRGNIWSFTVSPLIASEPSPYNGEVCVFYDPCTVLSWKPGNEATQSDLYLGTSPGSLNWVTTISHDGSERYSYEKSGLSDNQDYYWRVDEFNSVTSTTWTGDEWYFQTIPIISNPDTHLKGWWKFDEGQGKAIDWSGNDQHGTVYGGAESVEGYEGGAISLDGGNDYVELPIGTLISTLDSITVATWVNFDDSGAWWQRIFDFGQNTNINMFLTTRGGPGVLRFAITTDGAGAEFQVDAPYALPGGWHHVAVAIDALTENYADLTLFVDGASVNNYYTEVFPSDLGVTVNNWLGRSQYAADAYFSGILDDFRIYDFAMTQEDLKGVMASKVASLPEPANYATGVDQNPVLSWEPGTNAASVDGHQLYYSTDYDDVNDRVGDPIVLTNPTYTIPAPNAPYDSLTLVYWVVDEVNDAHTDKMWPGNIWRFTIKDYSLIDNFDLYSDTGKSKPPPADTLKSVWVDGNYSWNLTGGIATSGSLVQLNTDTHDGNSIYPHYTPDDNDIAQSDAQSMKFYYDNDGTVTWQVYLYNGYPEDVYTYTPAPDTYLSEAYAAVDDAAQADPQLDSLDLLRDWSGYNVLGLSFCGDPNNTTNKAGLYVGLKDADGTSVFIAHPDPTQLTKPWWQDWYVKLSDFTDKDAGLDLENIVRIYIGFGDKDSPASGGTGVVFFDDIQLFTGVCIPDLADVTGDLDGDCAVNNSDLRVLTNAEPWYGEKPGTLPAPIISLTASGTDGTPVTSWSNTAGSAGGTFSDFNDKDDDYPVLDTIDDKKAVVFSDVNDMLVWDHNVPGTVTGANDFTVVFEVFNPGIGVEEWILAWTERSEPIGTFAAFGYGTDPTFGAAGHWSTPDMGFGPIGAPEHGKWHTIGITYDGTTESIVVDGLVYDTEAKVLATEPNQPVVIGSAYEPAENGRIRGAWEPAWERTDLNYDMRFTGGIHSIKVYDEAIPAVELALSMGSPADMRIDDKIDFKDVAVLGNNWLTGPLFFGEDY